MSFLLGNKIKELRCARNLTQEQVAEKLGMTRQRLARMENGSGNINLEHLITLAEVFGVSVGDITSVLDEQPAVAYRDGEESQSSQKIFDMLDLFYANKHMYMKLKDKNS